MKSQKQRVHNAILAVIRYVELLSSSASAALLAASIIARDEATSTDAVWGCVLCGFIGAILVGWRKYKE